MGRENSNRTRIIELRLTPVEYAQIEQKWKASTCRKLSDYVRRNLFEKAVTTYTRNQSLDDFMAEMMLLRNELNHIGNNFNQAVKRLHALKSDCRVQKLADCLGSGEKDTLQQGGRDQKVCSKNSRIMVAIIKTGHSIHSIFNYNENKVRVGVAKCIGAGNYPIDSDKISLSMKLNRMLKQLELNENVKRNSVHISLNFHPAESHFEKEKLLEIAETYMDKIGFGKQPYLVYQHHDAGHPHIHLISIKVRPDGSRIDMNNIGRNQSEQARKAIEKEFGLVNAEAQKKQEQYQLKVVSVAKVMYGKSQTKLAIQNVLEAVLNQYRYTSLPELNAVLKQYNVIAERGGENSRVYQHSGLLYRILDADGNPVDVPIKASLFYNQPTLKSLAEKFKQNEAKRMPYKARIKNAIDRFMTGKKVTLPDLIKTLEKQGIHVALRQNDTGLIYGITYVDHQTKCVFNGSVLGKQYSAKAIQERCLQKAVTEQKLPPHLAQEPIGIQPQASAFEAETKAHPSVLQITTPFKEIENILDALMQTEQTSNYLPYHLKKKRKKRRRKNLNNNQ